jgi:hypothetical protein
MLTSSPLGNYTYGPGMQAGTNPSPLHAALAIGSSYTASYDQAGNMTCRAPNSGTTCSGSSPTGAPLTFDNEGRLIGWQSAPSSPPDTASFLYDGEGNRVEQQTWTSAQFGGTTTYIYLGALEKLAIHGSTTTTTTYYYAGGVFVALATNGSFSYLGNDGPASRVPSRRRRIALMVTIGAYCRADRGCS